MVIEKHFENEYILCKNLDIVDDSNRIHKLKPGQIIRCSHLTMNTINQVKPGTVKDGTNQG